MRLARLEREADRKMMILVKAYAKVPKNKKHYAYKVYLDLAKGKISFKEALKILRKLAKI